jgi:hypothetical protein
MTDQRKPYRADVRVMGRVIDPGTSAAYHAGGHSPYSVINPRDTDGTRGEKMYCPECGRWTKPVKELGLSVCEYECRRHRRDVYWCANPFTGQRYVYTTFGLVGLVSRSQYGRAA